MTVKEIVETYLKEHNYEGLFIENDRDTCSCNLDELMGCGEAPTSCQPGYLQLYEKGQVEDYYIGEVDER